jgi:hypothetical protein
MDNQQAAGSGKNGASLRTTSSRLSLARRLLPADAIPTAGWIVGILMALVLLVLLIAAPMSPICCWLSR